VHAKSAQVEYRPGQDRTGHDILTDDFRGLRQFPNATVGMVPQISRMRRQFREQGSWCILRDTALAYFAMTVKHLVANRGLVISHLAVHVISRKPTFSVSYRENQS
jgi:hypothetical protein